ncbi:MAG: Bacterial antitoxin of ParD toxin-antitoxin type system [Caulobacter sp.]|nr:Bacterial antitoxin of ParD toxin-antitoxin type system [Caulobacter sp.]
MNVRLKPEDLDIVRRRVEAGEYSDETEMVSRALALQEQVRQEKLEALKAALEEGEQAVRDGRYIDLETPEEIRAFIKSL